MIENDDEILKRINDLKKQIFFEILELAGRVFIIVDYDESVVIGKRGFLPEEKERGLVLVFNPRMNFKWEENRISAILVFGNTPEKCYIPINSISGVFSPDLRIQFSCPVFKVSKQNDESPQKLDTDEKIGKEKVIDISKLRKKR